MTENQLATTSVDIAYHIHKELGPGLLESVYEAAMVFELLRRNINFSRQKAIDAQYKGESLGLGFRADIILENKLIVEIKSVEHILEVHHKTVLTYMKLTDIKLALLINFNVNLIKKGIHRKILGNLES
ncbi:MAG: GxxExxY protein [Saprospiraceae bacterium]|nr:GxxExxY protein [Saprospiraceae bacterium]